MYQFVKLPHCPEDWDARIKSYSTRTLFHESAWHAHIQDIHPDGKIEYFEVRDGSELIGYHCAQRISKLGLRIHGSPLGGTGTNYMGPIVKHGCDQAALAAGLSDLLAFPRLSHIEVSHYRLDSRVMEAAGFQVHSNVTHLLRLGESEEEAWSALTGAARNRIRKAEKNGLAVEVGDAKAIVPEFFAQFTEVYAKQGMTPPFGADRAESLCRHLMPAERVLCLSVKHGDTAIATGFFPFDDRCIYFWGAASWLEYQKLSPNELLHWHVIKYAISRGLVAYNMCGGTSQFKDKFGGADVPYLHYSKSALPGLTLARQAYRWLHLRRLRSRRLRREGNPT